MALDNLDRARSNIAAATSEDLLARVTAFRDGMEPQAIALIEEELARRGVSAEQRARFEHPTEPYLIKDGFPLRCNLCAQPAVGEISGWYFLFRRFPVFPRRLAVCAAHRKA